MKPPFLLWEGDYLDEVSKRKEGEAPFLRRGRVVLTEQNKAKPEVMVRDAMGDPSWRAASDSQRIEILSAAVIDLGSDAE